MIGIYILKTRDGYRVTISNQYCSLFGNYDDSILNYRMNADILHHVFDNSQFFPNYQSALQHAMTLSKSCEETDDGIRIIDNCEKFNYWEIK